MSWTTHPTTRRSTLRFSGFLVALTIGLCAPEARSGERELESLRGAPAQRSLFESVRALLLGNLPSPHTLAAVVNGKRLAGAAR